MSENSEMVITIKGDCNSDLVRLIVEKLDSALVPVGFARKERGAEESAEIDYFQFGKAL